MSDKAVFEELRAFVAREILSGQDVGLDEQTPLLEWGLLDSFSLVSLLAFVQQRFGVEIPHSEVVPDNVKDLGSLTRLMRRLSRERAA